MTTNVRVFCFDQVRQMTGTLMLPALPDKEAARIVTPGFVFCPLALKGACTVGNDAHERHGIFSVSAVRPDNVKH